MDGILVVDKPQGLTSHDVVAAARRLLREKRIGHTGTLDPLATGVLPLACGRATRLVRFLTASTKDYEATIRFGIATDSYDITGEEIGRSALRPTPERLAAAVASLRGDYLQMPPVYSAKKVGGRRAYDLARRAEPVELTAVPVRVTRAVVTSFDGDSATVELTCSAGFYVRSFAHSLGEQIGSGACLEGLRRTRSGDFRLDAAVTLDAIDPDAPDTAALLVPMDELLPELPSVAVTDEGLQRISHGRELDSRHLLGGIVPGRPWPSGRPAPDPLDAEGTEGDVRRAGAANAEPPPEWVRLLDGEGRLLALASSGAATGALHPSVVLI